MIGLLCFVLAVLASPFKSKLRLQAENAVLRHQLIVVRRRLPGRVRLANHDRRFLTQLYRWFPSILQVLPIIRPETLVRWHRAGFRCYWRWKSCPLGGRPRIDTELRALIRQMSMENPLWGAPRIHGELLKLGVEVAQSSVAKYMVKRRGPPSQGWRTLLRNHAPDIAAMDLFVVPTIGFDLLYAFVIIRLDRRDLVWTNVTANPAAEWVARQITEAFPRDKAPHYLIRDRDQIYGAIVTRRLRAMSRVNAAELLTLSKSAFCYLQPRKLMADNLFDRRWRAAIPAGIGKVDASTNLLNETPLDDVRLPTRIQNGLRQAGFYTVGDVRFAPDSELRRWRHIGPLSLGFLRRSLGRTAEARPCDDFSNQHFR
jgi:hypothetical protein